MSKETAPTCNLEVIFGDEPWNSSLYLRRKFQAVYFTSPPFVLDEFYCTSGCFKSLFIVSLCVFVQQNERTFCFYEWVCVMQWYLLIQTSARAGSMATTPAVPLVLCKGTVMCCLETTLLIKTLSTSCSSLGNEKELLFCPSSSFFPLFLLLLCRRSWWEFFSPHVASPLPTAQSRLWCPTSLFTSPAYIYAGFHPSIHAPLYFSLFFQKWSQTSPS